jgi:hypothetical protein
MIFGRSGDPACTVPGFAGRHADLLVPINAGIFVIMPRFSGTVNSKAAQAGPRGFLAHAYLQHDRPP